MLRLMIAHRQVGPTHGDLDRLPQRCPAHDLDLGPRCQTEFAEAGQTRAPGGQAVDHGATTDRKKGQGGRKMHGGVQLRRCFNARLAAALSFSKRRSLANSEPILPLGRPFRARKPDLRQPCVSMLSHEGIVIQVRIGGIDTVDLGQLPGAQRFVLIQAPQPFQ